jgi:hypothetical protein
LTRGSIPLQFLSVHASPLLYSKIFLRLEPLGLEVVAQAARRAGHATRLIDLKFEDHPAHFRSKRLGGRPGNVLLPLSRSIAQKKSGSGGGNPEPRDSGRIARPCTRFGGQTCKGEPYAYYMGSGLGLLFEESVTIW